METEVLEVEGDKVGSGRLTVHTDGEGFETAEKEETVERSETDTGRIDEES